MIQMEPSFDTVQHLSMEWWDKKLKKKNRLACNFILWVSYRKTNYYYYYTQKKIKISLKLSPPHNEILLTFVIIQNILHNSCEI